MWFSQIITLFERNIFIPAAGLLIIGFIFSRLVNKFKFPRVTGYVIAGILLGPSFFRIFNEHSLTQFDFIPQFALGIIALVIGAGLTFNLLKRLKFLLIIITIFQSLGAFVLVFILLLLFKMPIGAALPLAAIASATAPAATIAVMREYRARGPLTETSLAVVTLDDAVAIILFGLVLAFNVNNLATFRAEALSSLILSCVEILTAILIGGLLGYLTDRLIKTTPEPSDSLIIILGVVSLAIGLSVVLNISTLLTNMVLGLTFVNISAKNSEKIEHLERMAPPIYCLFFVLAGAHLDFKIFAKAGPLFLIWGAIYVFARVIGKFIGAYFGGKISGAPPAIKNYLGWTLIPNAGLGIGLSLLISSGSHYYDFKSLIINLNLLSIAFNETIGPICTKYALIKAGEANLHEENIN